MKYVFSIVVLFLYSCSTDNETENVNANTQISGYKVTINSQSTDSSFPYVGQTITNGVVQNGKLMEVNEEFFLNGVSQGVSVNSSLTYQGSLLVSHMNNNGLSEGSQIRNYYYDSSSKLIGATRIVSGQELYYRFVYVSNDLIYFEKISLPYNDPNTQIISRCIAVFEDDDIVQAGRDFNLDGIMDNVNHFQYNNGNLIAVNSATQSLSFNYSGVINNMNVLNDNSYGKKNRRIVGIEAFSFDNFQGVLDYSKNLTNEEILQSTYEIHPSNYYHLKTNSYTNGPPVINFNATITKTTEFFFN